MSKRYEAKLMDENFMAVDNYGASAVNIVNDCCV